jgi:hypothetical protein
VPYAALPLILGADARVDRHPFACLDHSLSPHTETSSFLDGETDLRKPTIIKGFRASEGFFV